MLYFATEPLLLHTYKGNLMSTYSSFIQKQNFLSIGAKHFLPRVLSLVFLLFIFTNISAQTTWRSGYAYIENVQTGLVMDVQGNVKANGTNVWPYTLNYSRAQMFQFSEFNIPERYGDDARY